MKGQYGVYDGIHCLAEFDDEGDADEYRRELLEEHIPTYARRPAYDPDSLQVREMPEDAEEYAQLLRLYFELRASLRQDRKADSHDA